MYIFLHKTKNKKCHSHTLQIDLPWKPQKEKPNQSFIVLFVSFIALFQLFTIEYKVLSNLQNPNFNRGIRKPWAKNGKKTTQFCLRCCHEPRDFRPISSHCESTLYMHSIPPISCAGTLHVVNQLKIKIHAQNITHTQHQIPAVTKWQDNDRYWLSSKDCFISSY